jgi:hypothetical protein
MRAVGFSDLDSERPNKNNKKACQLLMSAQQGTIKALPRTGSYSSGGNLAVELFGIIFE